MSVTTEPTGTPAQGSGRHALPDPGEGVPARAIDELAETLMMLVGEAPHRT